MSAQKRREQLVLCAVAVARIAEHRTITAVHVSRVEHDLEIRRVLDTVVRRWSKPVIYRFTSSDALTAVPGDIHREHVVPTLVLVDRMIMNPDECKEILESVCLARVTKAEHQRLGGISRDHEPTFR